MSSRPQVSRAACFWTGSLWPARVLVGVVCIMTWPQCECSIDRMVYLFTRLLWETSIEEILVTGGAGFIGSNFVRYILDKRDDCHITVFDALTYAGHLENLEDVKVNPRFAFVKGDIRSAQDVDGPVRDADIVLNFAAESHVDRRFTMPRIR